MSAYYNEIDPYAVQWLRNLISAGHIAPGDVDERSIEDVCPDDLRPYTQHHFFAGIGVWSYALRKVRWPDDRRIWTASCPCQPFSEAGKGLGFADKRHLWPALFHLVCNVRPERIVGEQVASPNGIAWIDLVQTDLENCNYAPRSIVFPAAGVGAPHARHRTYWMADDVLSGQSGRVRGSCNAGNASEREQKASPFTGCDVADGMVDSDQPKRDGGKLGGTSSDQVANADRNDRPGPLNGFWRHADWLFCRDPRGPAWRPVEPWSFPLAHGASARMGRLRAYGNAIVADQAIAFLRAVNG